MSVIREKKVCEVSPSVCDLTRDQKVRVFKTHVV